MVAFLRKCEDISCLGSGACVIKISYAFLPLLPFSPPSVNYSDAPPHTNFADEQVLGGTCGFLNGYLDERLLPGSNVLRHKLPPGYGKNARVGWKLMMWRVYNQQVQLFHQLDSWFFKLLFQYKSGVTNSI